MKIVFCFFLLFYFCHCTENSDASENFWRREVKDGVYGQYDRFDSKDDYDQRDSIIRPCYFLDLNCIRGFFARNSQCLSTEGPVPDPYVLKVLPNLHIPHANITFTLYNAKIRGLDEWKIKEFFINKATGRLVLEVQFERIVVTSPEANLIYHRKGKEPIERSDYSSVEYRGLSFTLTIPYIKDLQLYKGHVYTYIPDAAPEYTLGPNIFSSKDPGYILAIKELTLKLGLTLQELFVSQGPVFFSIFLQNSICDFRYY